MAAAFQSPPFQNTAFQTAFSMDAFQRCAFQYPGFQTQSCPNPKQDGRSAYWRLFFMAMQEEALKTKPTNAVPLVVPETAQEAEVVQKKVVEKLEPLVKLERFPKTNFKRKAIYTEPTPVVEQNLPAWMLLGTLELQQWYIGLMPLWQKHYEVIIQQQVKAANDADIRLRLLLLAA